VIIDSHAHYNNNAYKKPFRFLSYDKDGYFLKEGDLPQLMQDMEHSNIRYFVEPGVSLQSCEEVLELAAQYPGRIFPAMGIRDKFAPVFYVRRMYKLSRRGNTKPGWYAGSQMVRKISQGNPRVFIQIMNNLFEKARNSELTPKAQHGVIFDYVQVFCESTLALESNGPTMHRELDSIGKALHEHVHGGDLRSTGCNFTLGFDSEKSFEYAKRWLQQAVAYSRIVVSKDILINGITKETEFVLANTYAARYWLPMRADGTAKKINIRDNKVATYTVKMPGKKAPPSDQLSLWGDDA